VGVRLLVFDLEIRDGRGAARAPVHQVLAAVDEPALVEADEGLAHGGGQPLVQGEAFPLPVAGDSQPALLFADTRMIDLLPLPGAAQELLTTQVLPREALLRQFPLHHVLGGDAGVVRAGHIERGLPEHAVVANHGVFDARHEGVPQVQCARYVRGRHGDDERLAAGDRAGPKVPFGLPPVIERLLDCLRVVGPGHLRGQGRLAGHGTLLLRRAIDTFGGKQKTPPSPPEAFPQEAHHSEAKEASLAVPLRFGCRMAAGRTRCALTGAPAPAYSRSAGGLPGDLPQRSLRGALSQWPLVSAKEALRTPPARRLLAIILAPAPERVN